MKNQRFISAALALSVIFFNTLPTLAQTFTLTMTSDTIACGNPGDEIYVYGDIKNTTASVQTLDVIRLENNIPANWKTATCIDICNLPTVDSFRVSFSVNETKTFIFHFYTGTPADSGNALVKLKNVSNPAETILQRFYGNTNCVLGISDNAEANHFNLSNYPNPATAFTAIQFTLLQTEDVALSIYNLSGQLIAIPISERKQAGTHTVHFVSQDLPAGIYFYRLQTGQYVQTKRMEIVK